MRIGWNISTHDAGRVLRFRWREHGGPPVTPAERRGFGTSLLESTLAQGLVELKPDGLLYEVEMRVCDIIPRTWREK